MLRLPGVSVGMGVDCGVLWKNFGSLAMIKVVLVHLLAEMG